ncbi:MAG: hypothetical protein ACK4N1_10505 [Pseudorhizobium sp.]
MDFIQWAIVVEQGGDLALAARDMDDGRIAEAGNGLGQAVVDALLEVYDGLAHQD